VLHSNATAIGAKAWSILLHSAPAILIRRRLCWLLLLSSRGDEFSLYLKGIRVSLRDRNIACGWKKGIIRESWANMRLKTLIRENCANINNGYGVDKSLQRIKPAYVRLGPLRFPREAARCLLSEQKTDIIVRRVQL
jgi:hypothetical protein